MARKSSKKRPRRIGRARTLTCQWCGRKFECFRDHARTCGTRCRQELCRQRRRDRAARQTNFLTRSSTKKA